MATDITNDADFGKQARQFLRKSPVTVVRDAGKRATTTPSEREQSGKAAESLGTLAASHAHEGEAHRAGIAGRAAAHEGRRALEQDSAIHGADAAADVEVDDFGAPVNNAEGSASAHMPGPESQKTAKEFEAETRGVKITRNAGGHQVTTPPPYASGSHMSRNYHGIPAHSEFRKPFADADRAFDADLLPSGGDDSANIFPSERGITPARTGHETQTVKTPRPVSAGAERSASERANVMSGAGAGAKDVRLRHPDGPTGPAEVAHKGQVVVHHDADLIDSTPQERAQRKLASNQKFPMAGEAHNERVVTRAAEKVGEPTGATSEKKLTSAYAKRLRTASPSITPQKAHAVARNRVTSTAASAAGERE